MVKPKWTVHQRVMRAARAGTGLRLNNAEVAELAFDGAVEQVAESDDARAGLCWNRAAQSYDTIEPYDPDFDGVEENCFNVLTRCANG